MTVCYALARSLYVALTNRVNSVSLIESRGPGFSVPGSFSPLAAEPTAEQVVAAVSAALADGADCSGGLCFAGAGEPLLRLAVIEQAAPKLLELADNLLPDGRMIIRVNTNGLQPGSSAAEVAARLRTAGVSSASIALMTADAEQYRELMRPEKLRLSPAFSLELGHAEVLGFVSACLKEGLAVECTAVASPGVDIEAARALAESLGAGFRARSWHAA